MTSGPTPNRSAGTEASTGRSGFRPAVLGPLGFAHTNGRAVRPTPARPNGEARVYLRLVRRSDAIVVVATLLAAFLAANIGRMPGGLTDFLAYRVTVKNLVMLALFALVWRLLGRLTGLYDWQVIRNRGSESARVVLTCSVVSAVALVFPALSVTGAFSYRAVLYFWLGCSVATLVLRNLIRTLVSTPEARRPREALIVGSGPRGQRLYHELRGSPSAEYNVVGFVDCADRGSLNGGADNLIGSLDEVEHVLMRHAIDEVLITLPIKSRYAEIQSVLETCERVGVPARYLADLFDPIKGRASHDGGQPALVMTPPAPGGWRMVTKRTIDVMVSAGTLLLLSPVLLVAAAAIKLSSPGPVVFTQERYGLNRRRFRMYKLRTMVVDAEALQAGLEGQNEASGPVFKIREDPRITRVGRLLRRTSLDEVPQLINVLQGEMSLVGPRPLPVRDVDRFTEAALMRRFSIRPGVTCLWQISGRSNLTFDDWIRLDLQYIDEWSFGLDLQILLQTVPAVLRGTGAS